jgi:hypothetical protein
MVTQVSTHSVTGWSKQLGNIQNKKMNGSNQRRENGKVAAGRERG